jgi:predicted RNase H-like nuclease
VQRAALAGVDGCRGGWVVACDGGVQMVPTFAHIVACSFDLVLIDVPIGLLDGSPRRCDIEARSLIGARRSSVFPAPSRSLLRSRRYGGQCSVQLWNILEKIREVDAAMKPALQRRVREAHPEVSFALLNGGPLRYPKKRAEGETERRLLLRPVFGEVPRVPGTARDDVLDAYVLLWSARRVLHRQERVLGSAERDARGLKCEIVG